VTIMAHKSRAVKFRGGASGEKNTTSFDAFCLLHLVRRQINSITGKRKQSCQLIGGEATTQRAIPTTMLNYLASNILPY